MTDHVLCDEDVTGCESYGDDPCVWLGEVKNVMAVDELEHAGTSTVNSRHQSHRVPY
jgi:hypothetical protein